MSATALYKALIEAKVSEGVAEEAVEGLVFTRKDAGRGERDERVIKAAIALYKALLEAGVSEKTAEEAVEELLFSREVGLTKERLRAD